MAGNFLEIMMKRFFAFVAGCAVSHNLFVSEFCKIVVNIYLIHRLS